MDPLWPSTHAWREKIEKRYVITHYISNPRLGRKLEDKLEGTEEWRQIKVLRNV